MIMYIIYALILSVAVSVGGGASSGLAQSVQTTQPTGTPAVMPGQWVLLPGSVASILWRDPTTGKTIDQFPGSYSGPGLLGGAENWVGAILDELRGYYVALNWGGHAATTDNSVPAFDILGKTAPPGDTPPAKYGGPRAWSRWSDPSPPAMQPTPQQDSPDFFPDGKAATTHSYGGMQHMLGPNGEIDRYWFAGGNKYVSGASFQSTGEYDPKTKTWRQSDVQNWGNKLSSAWDPSRLRVLLRDYVDLWQYDPRAPAGKRYTRLTNDQLPKAPEDYSGSALFDKQRARYAEAGIFANYGAGIRYYVLDPSSGAPIRDSRTGRFMRVAPIDLSVFPDLSPDSFWRSPSFLYDEISHDYVLHMGLPIKGGGNSSNLIFRVNPDTWAVTVERSSNSPSNSVRSGMYSKMRHLVSADLYVQVVNAREGVWLYRPLRARATSPTAPAPATAATSAPASSASTAALTGQFLGVTGEDKVGPNNQTTANGTLDWHLRLQNIKSSPTTVQIDSLVNGTPNGRWVAPFNGVNWIVARQFASGQLDLWFEPIGPPTFQRPASFSVTVTYADGTTASVAGIPSGLPSSTASSAASTSASSPTPNPATVAVPPGQTLPLRQWVERPNPAEGQAFMAGRGGKHGRAFYHPGLKSMVFAGGDWHSSMPKIEGYANGTGSEIWALNSANDKWTLLRPLCVPGETQPGRPDTVGWAYDSSRDRGLMSPGYYFMFGPGRSNDCGEIAGWGGYAFSFATRKFTGPDDVAGLPVPPGGGWGGDSGASYSTYDPGNDEYVRIYGTQLQRLNLATKRWRLQNLSNGNPNWNPITNRAQLVIDVAGRALFFVDSQARRLVRVSLVDGTVTSSGLPSQYAAPAGDSEVYLAFDPGSRAILVPNSLDMGLTTMNGLGIYHVNTGTWEWESVPAAVTGSVWGFDENIGALIGIGKRVTPPAPTAYFLYKYK